MLMSQKFTFRDKIYPGLLELKKYILADDNIESARHNKHRNVIPFFCFYNKNCFIIEP